MKTLLRVAVKRAIRHDAVAEEMRVLYVAMTRAKEKLIVTGCGKADEWTSFGGGEPTYQEIASAGTYLEWIRLSGTVGETLRMTVLTGKDLAAGTLAEEGGAALRAAEIRAALGTAKPGSFAPDVMEKIREQSAFQYEEKEAAGIPAKITVSELKRAGIRQAEEDGEELYGKETVIPYVPGFVLESGRAADGAARGTAVHHVLAAFDYGRGDPGEDLTDRVVSEIIRMTDEGILTPAEASLVDPSGVARFITSDTGKRMAEACAAGRLHREQPFVLDIPAGEIYDIKDGAGAETVLVQGTIDAYWEEDGGYVLVDYKTDRVTSSDGSELADRYRIQLEYYARALEQITGIPVREKIIYSIALGKEIYI